MTDTLQAPSSPEIRLPAYNAQRIGFAAGVVAAVCMLVAIVVVRLLSGVISLPEVVAEGLLTMMPGALFSAVLDSLQHAAKPLFYLAVGIGMLVVGGFLGQLYASQPTLKQMAKIVLGAWLVLGVGAYTVLGAGVFGQHLQAGPIWHGSSLLVVVGVFGLALFETYALLGRRALDNAGAPDARRRTLLRSAVVAVAATFATGTLWRLISGNDAAPSEAQPVASGAAAVPNTRSEEHTSELQSQSNLV